MIDHENKPAIIIPNHPETLVILILNELTLIRRAISFIAISPIAIIYIVSGIYLYQYVGISEWLLALMLLTPATVYFGLDIRAADRMFSHKK